VIVDTDTRKIEASMDVIIRPDGWAIPPDMTAIHGITTERAMEVGIPESAAVGLLTAMWNIRPRVGFNESFDARIIRIAMQRFGEHAMSDTWKAAPAECAMRMARPLMGLPKAPNLREAYKHFTGRELVDAHSAMADTRATLDVYFGVLDALRKVEPGHLMSEAESAVHIARLRDAPPISPEVATP
jgi:DNA polymerase-3 subunit epsilon